MKIAFVGKGGSGKTTLSALLSRYLAARGLPVLAIDADINQHLARTLGMKDGVAKEIPPMGLEIDRIKTYLRGTNPLIPDNASMIKTTLPGTGSRLLGLRAENPVFAYFSRMVAGVRLMAVGAFGEEDLGIRCYHSKTGSVELVLNHLIDKEREYAIADMTAGADSFASGLFTRFDITFLVVEPTIKSVSVYAQYKHYARNHGVSIRVIGNKVADADDEAFLNREIGEDMIGCVPNSAFVKRTDRGEILPMEKLEPEIASVLARVVTAIDVREKDWKKFYQQGIEFHERNAKSWANADTGTDVTKQIDRDFLFSHAFSA